MQLGDAGTLLLAEFDRFGILGLELVVQPVVGASRMLQFLLQSLLTILCGIGGSLCGLDSLIERRDLLVQLEDLLVLGLKLLGQGGVGLGLGVDNGKGFAIRSLERGNTRTEGLDFGKGGRSRRLEGL